MIRYGLGGLLVFSGILMIAAAYNNNLMGTWLALTNVGAKPTSSLNLPPELTPGNPKATNG